MNIFLKPRKISFNEIELDKYQSKAVLNNKKNLLLVAGAGSGKTLTICAKVKYLIDNNMRSNKILCISFTNETVNSLKNALEKNNINVSVKTFHKLALEILNNSYSISSNTLLDYVIEEYFKSYVYHDNTYKLLPFIDNIDRLKTVIKSFINFQKGDNIHISYILKLLFDNKIPSDDKIRLIFVLKVYILYEEELKSTNKIDFNDMINIATLKIDELKYFRYSYIIIDEYQDTSNNKYFMIKKLIDKFNIKIMAVGDDYQSIYSFSNCNLKLFTKFKKYFPNSKIIKLKNTYRNPKDIVEISKRFVLRNSKQIHKRLKSNKYISNPIEIIYINNITSTINYLVRDIDNIIILGRNNKDLNIKDLNIEDKDIRFLTVHKSKGLESDYVIVVNVIDDVLGFPNQIKEESILEYLKDKNNIEEERRLFYVALTRCKKKVFLLTEKNKESIFIKELKKEFKYKIKFTDLSGKTF
jgi:DNA helicase-4